MARTKQEVEDWELDQSKVCPLNLTGDDVCQACQ